MGMVKNEDFKMILKLGGKVKKVLRPFKPEGGAYGIGRTHSHKH